MREVGSPDAARVAELFGQYRKLCAWCDAFFASAAARAGAAVACRAGCDACCTLTSVTALEAENIRRHLAGSAPRLRRRRPASGRCVFLSRRRCTVYPARPIICRTHGLPLRHHGGGGVDACPMNRAGGIDGSLVLDMERINGNLMRLNLAYGMLTGRHDQAGKRVALASLTRGTRGTGRRGKP